MVGALLAAVAVFFLVLVGATVRVGTSQSAQRMQPGEKERFVHSLPALLAMTADSLENVVIARMNLLCAEGLPGSEGLDVDRSLVRLDEMVARVRAETERHY